MTIVGIFVLIVLSFFVEFSFCILCGNGADLCNLQAFNCDQNNLHCVRSGDGSLIVPNKTFALNICQSVSSMPMELVAPNDNETNAVMYALCPTAAFFDIVAVQGEPCNIFLVATRAQELQAISYSNWAQGEPNNNMVGVTGRGCSPDKLVESCVAFSVRKKKKDKRHVLSFLMHC
jgi:hypothetical protein